MHFFSLQQAGYGVEAFIEAPNMRVAQMRALFILTMMRGDEAWHAPFTLRAVAPHEVMPPWFPNQQFTELEASLRRIQHPVPALQSVETRECA